jgi:D-alanine-D-alanine ligase
MNQATANTAASNGHTEGDSDPLLAGRAAAQDHPLLGRPLRVAVLHNIKDYAPGDLPSTKDALAELDNLRNVGDYVAALQGLGHDVIALEGNPDLPQRFAGHPVDICFNTCEGFRGDSREAQVPALLEMLGMRYSASKVLALAVTLDKAMTKRVLAYHGLPTPHFQEFSDARQPLDTALRRRLAEGQPLFIKPNREGTGIGIYGDSLVRSEAELREKVGHILQAYRQTALVEEYVEGRDVTCGLVGNFGPDGSADGLHVFPISEVDHTVYPPGTEPFYSYTLKVDMAEAYRCLCPAPLGEALTAEVRRLTVETFRACGCLDVARVDFRLDAYNGNQPMILEINALPGLAYNSDMTLCAQAEGWSHYQLLQAVFNTALARYGLLADPGLLPLSNYAGQSVAAAPMAPLLSAVAG